MKETSQDSDIQELSDDPGDKDLPSFMQRATHRMAKGMKASEYDKHDHKEMVERCFHLTTEQKYIMNTLFSKYKELFSGNLGRVPGPPVKFKLKKEAKPFYSRAYTVPKAFETISTRSRRHWGISQ